jgi:hypothetical protein
MNYLINKPGSFSEIINPKPLIILHSALISIECLQYIGISFHTCRLLIKKFILKHQDC